MENASNAIKIAGELLIGLLLISLFIFVFQRISNLEEEKSKQVAIEQTAEFNKKFSAYNKSSMYGTDLISVLGLAYANNRTVNQVKYKSSNPENGYYDPELANSINIKFRIKTDICTQTTTTITKLVNGEVVDKDTRPPENRKVVFAENMKSEYHSLIGKQTGDSIETTDMVKNIYKILIEGQVTTVIKDKNEPAWVDGVPAIQNTLITEDVTGFTDMKKKIFKCTKVEYNDVGRINCMYFEEQ